MCVCLNSTPALGDDVQNISAHTWTCRPHCKLCYRQDLSPASPTHCSHILQIIPPFLINIMQLRPSNWLHKYPNQVSHQCVDIKHWCFQSEMWLNFCGATGIAILFRLPLRVQANGEFLLITIGCCSSTFMMLDFLLFAIKLMILFSLLTLSKLPALWFFVKFFKQNLLDR